MKRIRIVPPREVRIVHVIALIAFGALFVLTPALAQNRASPPPPDFPQIYETSDYRIRVVEVASGLANPWSLAFLPNGDMLVTERAGRLRVIRDGVLDPEPIAGIPEVHNTILGGLLDVVLDPDLETSQTIYLSYSKATGENTSKPEDDLGLAMTGLRPCRRHDDELTRRGQLEADFGIVATNPDKSSSVMPIPERSIAIRGGASI